MPRDRDGGSGMIMDILMNVGIAVVVLAIALAVRGDT